jgi:surfeit locus 1 family protein
MLCLPWPLDGNAPKSALLETGEPVGRPPKIELRNQHAVYAFTWTSISAITSALLWRVWKTGRVIKPRSGHGGR